MYINSFSVWIAIGLILCIAEFIKPNAWITFIMGLSALVVAIFSKHLSILSQVALWIAGQWITWMFIVFLIFITNLFSNQDADS